MRRSSHNNSEIQNESAKGTRGWFWGRIMAVTLSLVTAVSLAGLTGCGGTGSGNGAEAAVEAGTEAGTEAETQSGKPEAGASTEAEAGGTGAQAVATAESDTGSTGSASQQEDEEKNFEPFFRIDLDDPEAFEKELQNVRFLTKGKYTFAELDAKYGVDKNFRPSEEGMDTLNISGSAEFSEEQFGELAQELKEMADGREVYVIDLRQESHMLVNGISISWYGYENKANKGKDLSKVEVAEAKRFAPLLGTTVKAYGVKDNEKINSMDIYVTDLMTEKELVEREGVTYVRFPVTDHSWPEDEVIDDYIDFVRELDMENSWLHFHCQAGKGRTGVFMEIYDMMKNPGVPLKDVAARHAMTGSGYLLYAEESGTRASEHALRAKRMQQIYQYIQENHDTDYEVKWSEWIAQNDPE